MPCFVVTFLFGADGAIVHHIKASNGSVALADAVYRMLKTAAVVDCESITVEPHTRREKTSPPKPQ